MVVRDYTTKNINVNIITGFDFFLVKAEYKPFF